MKKFYEKSEIWFAVVWIIIYVMVMGNLKDSFGDDSIYTLTGLVIITAGLMLFVFRNGLAEKYGFIKLRNSRKYLFFIPILLICTLNLWLGVEAHYPLTGQIIAVVNMAIVGLTEELIFRGLLFRAIEKDNVKQAIIISAVTFGIGHIINLFTGQAGLDTVLQMLYAVALGFAFVMMFYKSGSIIPCVIAHSLIDVTSTFSNQHLTAHAEAMFNYIGSAIVIVVAAGYAIYLAKIRKQDSDTQQAE